MKEFRIVFDKGEYKVSFYTRFGGKYQLLWVDRFTSKFKFIVSLFRDIIKFY